MILHQLIVTLLAFPHSLYLVNFGTNRAAFLYRKEEENKENEETDEVSLCEK